jgi:hypothetical protein
VHEPPDFLERAKVLLTLCRKIHNNEGEYKASGNMTNTSRNDAKTIASIAVFAALYAVLGYIPLFYIFGSYGQLITASLVVAPIIGIILGPAGGCLAVAIGGIVGMVITGSTPLGIFTFLPGALDALCTGLAFRGKWYISAAIFATFIVAFAALPSIGDARWFVWFDAVGLFLLLSPATTLAAEYIRTFNAQKLVMGMGIFAFIGVLADHIIGSFIYQSAIAPLPQGVWTTVAFIYPVERLLVTIAAAIVGAAIIRGVHAAGLTVGEAII